MSKEKTNKKTAEKKPTPSPEEILKIEKDKQGELEKARAVLLEEKKRKISECVKKLDKTIAEINNLGCIVTTRGGWLNDKFNSEIIVIAKE